MVCAFLIHLFLEKEEVTSKIPVFSFFLWGLLTSSECLVVLDGSEKGERELDDMDPELEHHAFPMKATSVDSQA
jgi:hypothetical protein